MANIMQNTTHAITNSGNTRYVHFDGTSMGFLNTGGGWDMLCDNSGSIYTPAYGYLQNFFFNYVVNCATQGLSGYTGTNCTINCYGGNCDFTVNCQGVLFDNGSYVTINSVSVKTSIMFIMISSASSEPSSFLFNFSTLADAIT